MQKAEWEKLWAYIVGCYPSWKPNSITETSWLNELRDYQPSDVIAALRESGEREKSSFPPSVFKLVAELRAKRSSARTATNGCNLCHRHPGVVLVTRRTPGRKWPESATLRCSCSLGSAIKATDDYDKRVWSQWGEKAQQRGWCLD